MEIERRPVSEFLFFLRLSATEKQDVCIEIILTADSDCESGQSKAEQGNEARIVIAEAWKPGHPASDETVSRL